MFRILLRGLWLFYVSTIWRNHIVFSSTVNANRQSLLRLFGVSPKYDSSLGGKRAASRPTQGVDGDERGASGLNGEAHIVVPISPLGALMHVLTVYSCASSHEIELCRWFRIVWVQCIAQPDNNAIPRHRAVLAYTCSLHADEAYCDGGLNSCVPQLAFEPLSFKLRVPI